MDRGAATAVISSFKETEENISQLKEKGDFPDILLLLITHSSELAIEESMKFGNNTKEFATKVEDMWQDIMKEYLTFSSKSTWIQADKSSHFIHLTQSELLHEAIEWVKSNG